MTIDEICREFAVKGDVKAYSEITVGIINNTYKVVFDNSGKTEEYVLQRINKFVFKKPYEVMDNIVRVTEYIKDNVQSLCLDPDKYVLCVVYARDGKPYVTDENEDYWRLTKFIKNSCTFNSTEDLKVIENAGAAFGLFQNWLDGFNAPSLYITIPNFHNTISRYKDLHTAIAEDRVGRKSSVKSLIEELLSYENKACELQRYLDEGKLPIRVTHNDTKCNNVSFDVTTGEALAVLDLDTVMPGAVAHDYGDAIRYIANTAKEDEKDESKVSFDFDKFKAFSKGFIEKVKDKLTDLEKETLALGIFTLTTELAVRFLTDYLNGDVYFKIRYSEHNLVRTQIQTALARAINKDFDKISEIVKDYFKN